MKLNSLKVLALAAGILTACSDPTGPVPPSLKSAELLKSLKLNVKAAILAVGDSIDLKAVGISLSGDTIAIPDNEIVWGTSDPDRVRVNQNGRVHVIKHSDGGLVSPWVRWTSHGVTRADSSFFVTTQNRDPVARLEIRPLGDSLRIAIPDVGVCCGVSVIARNAAGDSLGVIRSPLTGDHDGVTVNYNGAFGISFGWGQYTVFTRRLGPLWLRTEAFVYGQLLRDSLQLISLYPLNAAITFQAHSVTGEMSSTAGGNTKLIQPCGSIEFMNFYNEPIEVTFDDPSLVSGCVAGDATGDIETISAFGTISRKVPSGTVTWTARVKNKGALSPSVSGTVTTREL